jgi:hypothetical protein
MRTWVDIYIMFEWKSNWYIHYISPKPRQGRYMKKFLFVVVAAIVLFGTGFFIGMHLTLKGNLAEIAIENRSEHSIMTAIVSHEKGSAIAANIKKNRTQRVRFFTHGPNHYTMRVTFDDNRTIYSQDRRPIENGETVRETVTDSTVSFEKE